MIYREMCQKISELKNTEPTLSNLLEMIRGEKTLGRLDSTGWFCLAEHLYEKGKTIVANKCGSPEEAVLRAYMYQNFNMDWNKKKREWVLSGMDNVHLN